MKTLTLAFFLGIASSFKLAHKWADGLTEDEFLDSSAYLFESKVAAAAAKEGSGVRAKWVELPTCNRGTLAAGEIALEANHENASKATCKNHDPSTPPPTPSPEPVNPNTPVDTNKPLVFDPVVKTSTIVKDSEHHVEQHENMENASPTLDNGPRGDWNNGKWSMM